ncbi:MAG TPA: hypothetical protein VF412_09015 [Bdellovibrio sp.]|uniref:hypothetical protein n=1 Tax=Bdellovibrio sp. TaxID=28201 RepID=UPI002F1C65FB
MNKKNIIILAVIVAVLLVISYCYFGGSKQKVQDFPPDLPNPAVSTTPTPSANLNEAPAPSPSQTPDANGFLPTKMEDPHRFEALQKNFKDMSVCLNMKLGPFTQSDDMNFETLNTIIAPDLGDIVTTSDDWSATDIKTNSGEIRRIFVQNSANSNTESVRTVKYYVLQANGTQKELPLTKEQSVNPSDSLISSLEGDGQLVTKSVAKKVFYQNGDDLSVVERNGKIYSFGLAHDGKTFKCQGVDSGSVSCSCQ